MNTRRGWCFTERRDADWDGISYGCVHLALSRPWEQGPDMEDNGRRGGARSSANCPRMTFSAGTYARGASGRAVARRGLRVRATFPDGTRGRHGGVREG